MSDLVPRESLPVESPERAEFDRREDELEERRRLERQTALAVLLVLVLAARIILVGN